MIQLERELIKKYSRVNREIRGRFNHGDQDQEKEGKKNKKKK
jgi:hypothetical protein